MTPDGEVVLWIGLLVVGATIMGLYYLGVI